MSYLDYESNQIMIFIPLAIFIVLQVTAGAHYTKVNHGQLVEVRRDSSTRINTINYGGKQ